MSNNIINRRVLVLNQNYEPLSVCTVKRAVVLTFLGKADIVESLDGRKIRSPSRIYPVPSVVRLGFYVRVPSKRIMLSRKNILKRDGHRCQYCGTANGSLTIDHVLPKIYGGKHSWDNLVCACTTCNSVKGDKTPEQAGLKLLRKPRKPNHITFIQQFIGVSDQRWRRYLFLD